MRLLWKECREVLWRGVFGLVVGLCVSMPILSRLLPDIDSNASPTGSAGVGASFVLWCVALWVGFDIVGAESARDTWTYLRSRAVGNRAFAAAKFLPRLAIVAGVWGVTCVLPVLWIVRAIRYWEGPSSANEYIFLWTVTSAPYLHAYLAVSVLATGLCVLGFSALISSTTAHRGIVLGVSALGSAPLLGVQYWFWLPVIRDDLAGFTVPRTTVAVLCAAALLLLTAAAARLATLRKPGLFGHDFAGG